MAKPKWAKGLETEAPAQPETPSTVEREVVRTVVSMGPDDRLSKFIDEPEYPWVEGMSEVSFRDPFKFPEWCDQKTYAYAWVNKADEVQMDEYVYSGVYRIVKRINHADAPDSAFRMHGAVERRGQILIFRPIRAQQRALELRAQAHNDLMKANKDKFTGGAPISTTPEGKVQTAFYAASEDAAERHSFTLDEAQSNPGAVNE